MKSVSEIKEGLSTKYSGLIKQLDGYDYIPWNEAVRAANTVFDPDGYDVEIIKTWREEVPNPKGEIAFGYASIVRVTVRPADGKTFFRDGLGFSELIFTQEKSGTKSNGESYYYPSRALIDSAIKGCVSRSLLRALVLLGEAFGLFLYDKEDDQSSTGASPKSNNGYKQANGSSSGPVTEKQIPWLKKSVGLNDEQIATLDFKKASNALNLVYGKTERGKVAPEQVRKELGFASSQKSSSLDDEF